MSKQTKYTLYGIIKSSKPALTKNNTPYQVVSILSPEGFVPQGNSTNNQIDFTKSSECSEYTVSIWGAKPEDTPYGSAISLTISTLDFPACPIKDISLSEPTPYLQSLLPKVVSKTLFFAVVDSLSSKFNSTKDAITFQTIAERLFLPYSKATAARTHHHNYQGGLLQHTYELLNLFNAIYSSLPFPVNPFIVSLSCLLHDVGKLKEYMQSFDYTPQFFLLGHPFMGAELAGQLLKEFDYTQHLIEHVQHCILSHHQRLEYGSPVLPASPEAYLVSQLDALSGIGVQYNQPQSTKALSTQIQRF